MGVNPLQTEQRVVEVEIADFYFGQFHDWLYFELYVRVLLATLLERQNGIVYFVKFQQYQSLYVMVTAELLIVLNGLVDSGKCVVVFPVFIETGRLFGEQHVLLMYSRLVDEGFVETEGFFEAAHLFETVSLVDETDTLVRVELDADVKIGQGWRVLFLLHEYFGSWE